MSASTTPTLRPPRASATARLAVRVDLPTPPLPEPTTTIWRPTLSAISATRTSVTPARAPTTCSSSRCSFGPPHAARIGDERGYTVGQADRADARSNVRGKLLLYLGGRSHRRPASGSLREVQRKCRRPCFLQPWPL